MVSICILTEIWYSSIGAFISIELGFSIVVSMRVMVINVKVVNGLVSMDPSFFIVMQIALVLASIVHGVMNIYLYMPKHRAVIYSINVRIYLFTFIIVNGIFGLNITIRLIVIVTRLPFSWINGVIIRSVRNGVRIARNISIVLKVSAVT